MMKNLQISSGVAALPTGLLTPHRLDLARPPVVYGHGAGALSDGWAPTGTTSSQEKNLSHAIVKRGFSLGCSTQTVLFGNDVCSTPVTGRTPLTTAYVRANGRASDTKKSVLVGGSMGSFASAKAIARDPLSYQCAVYLVPFFGLQMGRDTDVSGLRAAIDAAYGVVYPAALPAGADLTGEPFMTNLASVPSLVVYSDNDFVSFGADPYFFDFLGFCTAIGATVIEQGEYGYPDAGHVFMGLSETDPLVIAICDFIEANSD